MGGGAGRKNGRGKGELQGVLKYAGGRLGGDMLVVAVVWGGERTVGKWQRPPPPPYSLPPLSPLQTLVPPRASRPTRPLSPSLIFVKALQAPQYILEVIL